MKWFKRERHISLPEVVYELKPGGVYLIEYQEQLISMETIDLLYKRLMDDNIKVHFVPNPAPYRAFEPIPATPNTPKESKGKK